MLISYQNLINESRQKRLLTAVLTALRSGQEITVWKLLFMQDFFASTRLYRVHTFLLPKGAVHYLYHLNSRLKEIGQRKVSNTEKHFYP